MNGSTDAHEHDHEYAYDYGLPGRVVCENTSQGSKALRARNRNRTRARARARLFNPFNRLTLNADSEQHV